MTTEQRAGWRANKARDQVHIQPSLEKTHRGMWNEPRDKGRRVCVKTRRRHLKSLSPKCKYPPKPRTPGLIDGVGVITRDYWRYAANYISFFLFLAAHGGGLRGRKRKHSTLLLNKWLKENIPGLMLIWSGTLGRFSLFRLFSLFFFFFGSFFSPVQMIDEAEWATLGSSSAVVASRCVATCWCTLGTASEGKPSAIWQVFGKHSSNPGKKNKKTFSWHLKWF